MIGLTLSTLMIQQCFVNGQNCYIDNFNNSTEYFKNCENPANVKSLVLNVTKLEIIPNDLINLTLSIESIDVSDTSLQFVNHTLNLCQWPKLKSVDAEDNNITELQSNILSDCHQLSILNLARNNISLIYDQAFTGLSLLKELDLSNNQLKSISAETFKPLGILYTLRLNNNQIRTINLDNFAKNIKLQVLDLSFNAIIDIEDHAFQNLKDLSTLSIQCNPSLKTLNLNGMDKLNTLNANNASLSELDIPKSIVNVNADNNRIMYVSIETNSTLRNLSLKNNSFQNLSNLSMALHLQELDISNNNITDIDFAPLMGTNVDKITILENPIQTFNVSTLVMLPKIKMIEISTSRLEKKILLDLLMQTKAKGIRLEDPNRSSELIEVVTLPPVTPVDKTTISTTTLRPAIVSTTTASPTTPTTPATTSSKSNSNSTDVEIKKLLKRIQKLESSLANPINKNSTPKVSTMEHDEIEHSLSNLRVTVNCMMLAIFVFAAFKLVIFFRANQWSIPSISRIFSRTPNVRVNGRRNPFHDSMDPIIEEVL